MEVLKVVLKSLLILATVFVMALPFILEFATFGRDKDKKISYKRFRMLVFALVYVIAITVVICVWKDLMAWLGSLRFVQWLAQKVAVSARTEYYGKILVAILANFCIGGIYVLLSKLVRIGLEKKNLTIGKKADGSFNWRQKAERAVIRFFHTETWFFVAVVLKYLNILLSGCYLLCYASYQLPGLFGAEWIPYAFLTKLFTAGYMYPAISLLAMWQMYFFLEGIRCLEKECPELLFDEPAEGRKQEVDLAAIDAKVRQEFRDFYVCDVDLSASVQEELSSTHHHSVTEFIAQAVENDKRNPQLRKESYLTCLDRLVEGEKGLLINGNFFSEFSMYFLRYLSSVVARGDNVVFVCNSEAQIDATYDYLIQGLSEISSLYCKGFQTDAVDFDDPIWRAIKISGEREMVEEASVDENNILVTSLSYLSSSRFEAEHSRFIAMIDVVVFVDTLETVNTYSRQMAVLNTHLRHVARKNAIAAKNSKAGEAFRMRYMSRQVRYICFDDTRTPDLDKVLKNMLAVEFDSADAMRYHPATLVRCYKFEGTPDENGRVWYPQALKTEEEIGAIMNMALRCLENGAGNVTVFTGDILPYEKIWEAVEANMGQLSGLVDHGSIRLNKRCYNPDDYSVIIAMDNGDNLPATLRRYLSMVSDKPALVIVFSRPYMMRDYYISNINDIWNIRQMERVPVEEGTKRDIAQKILVKANAGGISRGEIMRLASLVDQFGEFVRNDDLNGVLRAVLEVYGASQEDRLDLFRYFEYVSHLNFDENGKFDSQEYIVLRRQGELFEQVNGRDMVVMVTSDEEVTLSVPRNRLTQNFIAGQNFVHNGNIYHIQKIDIAAGKLYARLAVGGEKEKKYQYIQDRHYHVEMNPEQMETVFPSKHVTLRRAEGDVGITDVYISVFRAPMEVTTDGYYEMDPHILAVNPNTDPAAHAYMKISDPGNDLLAKQSYRRYGQITQPAYSSESLMKLGRRVSNSSGALMMSLRVCGEFGPDVDKTMALAAAMLNELLRSMFPSVADSIVVCPVLHKEFADEESRSVLQKQPSIAITGDRGQVSATDFDLMIIEDCESDLGVVSVLMAAGDDVLRTLFAPLFGYLGWYQNAEEKSSYLYYGTGHEPACFDFASLYKLAKLLGDDGHDMKFMETDSLVAHDVCDFCGKRYPHGDDVIVLDDGRKMCRTCAGNLVGNNKKILKAHLDRARIFLESTYGITLGDDYEFCFESTVKIANTLKQNSNLLKRGTDIPLKSYVDERKRVHVEYSIPSVNLSELLVRELTHVWQLKHLPELAEDLAEGHLALVGIQYLRFLNQSGLAAVRANYYESSRNISGEGYRRLVRELLEHPQFNNNPFRYLLEASGLVAEDVIPAPDPTIIDPDDTGLPHTPETPDRVTDGPVSYFFRNHLTATQQRAYAVMLEAIQNHTAQFTVEGCDFEQMKIVSQSISFDHPELFWYNTFAMQGDQVRPIYGATAEEAEVLQRRMDEVIPKYLEGIDETMSGYDVAIRLHMKVIASVDYDTIALNKEEQAGGPAENRIDYLRTICGVFLNGKAVCEGYARAMQYLLQKCGVECAEVAGNIRKENGEDGGGHAWNIVKLDGEYYYLDTTWDDSSNTVQTVKSLDPGFNYFCITTEELLRTRDLDLNPAPMPACTATACNYYHHNDLVLEQYDLAKIKLIAQNAAKAGRKFFAFKCGSKALFEEALARLCAEGDDCYDAIKAAAKSDKRILTNQYAYSYDKNIRTITVKFRYK